MGFVRSVRVDADINAFATNKAKTAAIMVWNYHDDNLPAPDAPVSVRIQGVPARKVTLRHYRIDKEYSSSYQVWEKLGSP